MKKYMKKIIAILLILCMLNFVGCADSTCPTGELAVKIPVSFHVGYSYDIEIKCPDTEGTKVTGWKDEKIEVIEGKDYVKVEGLTITCLKEGKVKARVSVTTVLSQEALEKGYKEREYTREINFNCYEIEY